MDIRPNTITTSGLFLMQTQDGQFIDGQFILEAGVRNNVKVTKFVTNFDGEFIYMNVEGNIYFESEGSFQFHLNPNIHREVFNKATFTSAGNITSPEWTLTLG